MARVLVVDDHPNTAHSFALLLRAWGHEAHAATGGAEALRLALSFPPDVALIDLHMPDVGGHEVARRLRATPGLERALLLAVTGVQPGDRRRGSGAEFDAFLLKPVDPDELRRLIDARVAACPTAAAFVEGM
jgi:CheY-like chemotaxis protein